MALGLCLSLASTAALNWGFFVQHGAASGLPRLSVRKPVRSLLALFGNARWRVGFATGVGGWALYVGALALAPLSIVQAACAGGFGLLAVLASRSSSERPRAPDRIGVSLAVLGLALLGVSLAGPATVGTSASTRAVVVWLAVSGFVALLAVGPAMGRLAPGAGFGLAAGIFYAAGDVATKAAVGGNGLAFVPLVFACHGLAFVVLQLGFQRGGLLATVGVATLFTNAVPIAAGTTIFHEGIPSGALGAVRVVAFAATVAGAALLAGASGRFEDARSADGVDPTPRARGSTARTPRTPPARLRGERPAPSSRSYPG